MISQGKMKEKKEEEFKQNIKIEKKKYSWEYFIDCIEKLVKNNSKI